MMRMSGEKLAKLGMLLALSLIFSYVEILVPVPLPIPGAKLGLANLIVMFLLVDERYFLWEILLFQVVRAILSSLLFANAMSFLFSIAGGVLSVLLMYVVYHKLQFDYILTSIIGGLSHNIAQIVVARFVVSEFSIFYYLPFLLICGLLAGGFVGLLLKMIKKRLYK